MTQVRGRILVVDDMAHVAESIQKELSTLFDVDIATSAVQALDRIRRHNYFGIIVDVHLDRGAGGLELVAKVRSGRERIRVIVISAYTPDDAVRRRALELGGSYLQKPASASQLIELLQNGKASLENSGEK